MTPLVAVVWKGEERFIPRVGIARKGEMIRLSPEQAKKYVDSGQAEYSVEEVSKPCTE